MNNILRRVPNLYELNYLNPTLEFSIAIADTKPARVASVYKVVKHRRVRFFKEFKLQKLRHVTAVFGFNIIHDERNNVITH